MQTKDEPILADSAQVRYHLDLLSSVEPSGAPMLSCYLDAQAGEAACQRFLDNEASRISDSLSGAARVEFETALETARSEVARHWHAEAKGLAIFARGPVGGRLLTCMTTTLTLENRLTFYDVPDLLPLIDGLGREAPFTLILARRNSGIQVLDLDAGHSVPRAWLALPGALERMPAESGSREDRWGRKRHVTVAEAYSRFARRVLAAQASRPIVIAGDAGLVEQVASWLPQRSRHRLLEQLVIPAHVGDQEALARVRQLMQANFTQRADGMARRVVRAATNANPIAVTGVTGSLDMLRAGLVKTLLVSRSQPADKPSGPMRASEEALPSVAAIADPRQTLTDLVQIAAQRGVTIVATDAQDLRDCGGVACLLTETTEFQLMPEPALPRHLDLVA